MPTRAEYTKNFDHLKKMDPFLKIKYNQSEKMSTIAKNQGKFPVWNNRFCIEWEASCRELIANSYDYDTFSDDFIGTGKHTFSLNKDDTTMHEISIDQYNQDKFFGKIFIKYYWSSTPVEEILCPKVAEEIAKQQKQQSEEYLKKLGKVQKDYPLNYQPLNLKDVEKLFEIADFRQSVVFMQSIVQNSSKGSSDLQAVIAQLSQQNKVLLEENQNLQTQLVQLSIQIKKSEHQQQQQQNLLAENNALLKQENEHLKKKLNSTKIQLLTENSPTNQFLNINDLVGSSVDPTIDDLLKASAFQPVMAKSIRPMMVQSQFPLQSAIQLKADKPTIIKFESKLFEISDQVTEQDLNLQIQFLKSVYHKVQNSMSQ